MSTLLFFKPHFCSLPPRLSYPIYATWANKHWRSTTRAFALECYITLAHIRDSPHTQREACNPRRYLPPNRACYQASIWVACTATLRLRQEEGINKRLGRWAAKSSHTHTTYVDLKKNVTGWDVYTSMDCLVLWYDARQIPMAWQMQGLSTGILSR